MTNYFPTDQPIQFSWEPIQMNSEWPKESKRILVIGPSDLGSFHELVLVHSIEKMEERFGSGVLIQAASQALKQSAEAIWMLRTDWSNPTVDFQMIQSVPLDMIVLAGVQVPRDDEILESFFAYALEEMDSGRIVHGIVSVEWDQSIAEIEQWISSSIVYQPNDRAKHLSLVLEQFVDRHAGGVYAGVCVSTYPFLSLTNQMVPPSGFKQLKHEKLAEYKRIGVVAFKWQTLKQTVIAHSPCATSDLKSTFRSITNVRMIQFVLAEVHYLVENLIGNTNPSWMISKIEDELNDYFLFLKIKEFLRSYQVRVFFMMEQQAIGIELDLAPIFALESIRMHSKVMVRR